MIDRNSNAFIAACDAFNAAPICPDLGAEIALAEAIAAWEKALWQPIETAPPNTRIVASGYQRPTSTVAGYWWSHDDFTSYSGEPITFSHATRWRLWPTPPEEV